MLVASYNVHKCVGADGFRPDLVAAVIGETGARVAVLQEVDRRFGRRSGLLDLEAIERQAGLRPLPVSTLPDGHGWHGNAILVGDGIVASRIRRVSLPGMEPRGAVIADLEIGRSGPVRVVATHLGLLPGCRMRQAEAILELLDGLPSVPTVLMGDLNEFRTDGSALGVLEGRFFRTATAATFPARWPVLSLDRILADGPNMIQGMAAHDTPLARRASDHLPVVARLLLRGAQQTRDSVGQWMPQSS